MYQLPMFLNLQFKYMHACEFMHGSLHCYNIVVHVGAMTFTVCNTPQSFTLH